MTRRVVSFRSSLQWGRGFVAAETEIALTTDGQPPSFNGAAAL